MKILNWKRFAVSLLVFLVCFSGISAFADPADDVDLAGLGISDLRSILELKTNCDSLNVRDTPNGSVIGNIHDRGSVLEYLGFNGETEVGWIHIWYDGLDGWVYGKYVDIVCLGNSIDSSNNKAFLMKLLDKAVDLGLSMEFEHSDTPISTVVEMDESQTATIDTYVAPIPDEDVSLWESGSGN